MSKVIVNVETELRPWGSFTVLEEGVNYKVKRILVEPGKRLSLQYHNHRSEHWVIVSGIAKITLNDEVKVVYPDETIYVSCGTHHRLENVGQELLVVVEVQFGSYLGEDDIIRLDDDYKR